MITINKEVIKSFNPCVDRWKNWLEHYLEFNGDWDDFLDLDKISYEDKIWIAKKVLNRNQLVHFSILCAESVLSIYEEKYPNDKRIHDCLNYMKTIIDFSLMTNEQRERLYELRKGVWSCYTAAVDAAATYAVDAAATYASDAAYGAASDADASSAVDAYAVDAAAYGAAAYGAAAARTDQQNINIQFLKMVGTL